MHIFHHLPGLVLFGTGILQIVLPVTLVFVIEIGLH